LQIARDDAVELELEGGLVDGVGHVVDGPGEGEEILAVEGGRVRLRQLVDQDAAHLVGLALDILHRLRQPLAVDALLHESWEQPEELQVEVGLLAEQLDEAPVVGAEDGDEGPTPAHGIAPARRSRPWTAHPASSARGSVSSQLNSISRTTCQR